LHHDDQKTDVVTIQVWEEAIQHTLGLHVPFLQFQEYLGLPAIGVDGKKDGPIDYMDFCNRYMVFNNTLGANGTGSTSTFFADMMHVMFSRRYELESLFRFFDADGNGKIDREEFKTGLSSLATVLGKTFTEEQVYELVDAIDTDHDGEIDYQEFLSKFQTTDLTPEVLNPSRRETHHVGNLPDMKDVQVIDPLTSPRDQIAVGSGQGRTLKKPLKRFKRAANKIIAVNRIRGIFDSSKQSQ
jgi:hypothetical protein